MSALTSTESLVVTREGTVATLWLNRPERRNAVDFDMWVGIRNVCQQLAPDPTVRVLIVRGIGGHFCAGADITGLRNHADASYADANRAAEEHLAGFPKPTIAFITGSCVGGGVQLALACDLRIADRTARFGITPAKLGIIYPSFALARAVRLLGPSAVKHLVFSAELIDAEGALRIGLVDEVHEPGAATDRVTAFTSLMATERSLLTQQASKEMIDAIVQHGAVDDQLGQRWAEAMRRSPDMNEGIAAFQERRPPKFTWTGLD